MLPAVPRRSPIHRAICCWWALCAAEPALALEWATLGPLPSPAPGERVEVPTPDARIVGLHGPVEWTRPHADPLAIRALTHPEPGGSFLARADFESDFSGPVAVRLRAISAHRVWLDGRLLGGRMVAAAWTDAPLALPAALAPGRHQLLVELNPPAEQPVWLAAAITTPAGEAIALRAVAPGAVATPAALTVPIAIAPAALPAATRPSAVWRPPAQAPPPGIDPPEVPPLTILRALPPWPDAQLELLADHQRWRLDSRAAARAIVLRINSDAGSAAAQALLAGFDGLEEATPDGWAPAGPEAIAPGAVLRATRRFALPPDPLRLGAARLDAPEAPVWRWQIDLDAPRDWTVALRSRGLGGARIVDEAPGRRVRRIVAEAVAPQAVALRISRAEGAAGFAAHARAALVDALRPFPGQPTCGAVRVASTLREAIDCARSGRPLSFQRAPGRPPLDGPVDLGDFDALGVAPLDDAIAYALGLDGAIFRGPGITALTAELRPDAAALPALPLGGPCAEGPVAAQGEVRVERAVAVAGLEREAPHARRLEVGPLVWLTEAVTWNRGWIERGRLSWQGLDRWSPRRVQAFCRRLEALR